MDLQQFLADLNSVHASFDPFDELAVKLTEVRKWVEKEVKCRLPKLPKNDPAHGGVSLLRPLGQERDEVRHTKILGWLLDPNKTKEHGFGDKILLGLLNQLLNDNGKEKVNATKEVNSLTEYVVPGQNIKKGLKREKPRTDVFVQGKYRTGDGGSNWTNFVLLIEAKIDAKEGQNQLKTYEDNVIRLYPDRKPLFVFLTLDGRESEQTKKLNQTWFNMSLLDIGIMIRQQLFTDNNYSPAGADFTRLYLITIFKDLYGYDFGHSESISNYFWANEYINDVIGD